MIIPVTVATTTVARRLLWLNVLACALHFALGVSALISTADRGSIKVPVFWPRAEWNATECSERGFGNVPVCPATRADDDVGRVNLSVVLIVSQLITCSFHAVQAWQSRHGDSTYIQWSLVKGIKVFHWVEYTITGALIAWVVSYYSGMLELWTQVLALAAQSTLMLIGLLQDTLRYSARKLVLEMTTVRVLIGYTFVIGFSNVLSLWGGSLYRLFIDSGGYDPPDFVKWIVMAEFLIYTSFGISQLVFYFPLMLSSRIEEVVPRFYLEEVVLTLLSFAAKAVLATAFSVCLVYGQCGD